MTANQKFNDFSNVGYDEALRRAEDLIPFLREHAPAADRATHMVPEVEAALHKAGLFRYHQPKAWGGMELDFVAYVDIPEMLARGDCSVGWNVANLSSHHRNVAHFCEAAQQEMWGENPDCLIASGIAFAQGRGEAVEGGIRLTGRWSFSSGVDISQWNMLGCQLREVRPLLTPPLYLRISRPPIFSERIFAPFSSAARKWICVRKFAMNTSAFRSVSNAA